jgi:hypothetical protein
MISYAAIFEDFCTIMLSSSNLSDESLVQRIISCCKLIFSKARIKSSSLEFVFFAWTGIIMLINVGFLIFNPL